MLAFSFERACVEASLTQTTSPIRTGMVVQLNLMSDVDS